MQPRGCLTSELLNNTYHTIITTTKIISSLLAVASHCSAGRSGSHVSACFANGNCEGTLTLHSSQTAPPIWKYISTTCALMTRGHASLGYYVITWPSCTSIRKITNGTYTTNGVGPPHKQIWVYIFKKLACHDTRWQFFCDEQQKDAFQVAHLDR